MFLDAHHFEGEPADLAAAHDRLAATYSSESLAWHVCAVGEQGIVVVDACPSRADFEAFSRSAEFLGALAEVGLPEPRIVPLGEMRSAIVATGAVTP